MSEKIKIQLRQSDFFNIQTCKRKMFLNNVAEITFPESQFVSAANQGTLLHAGLTGIYAGLDWAAELNKQADIFKAEGKDPDAVNDALDMSHSVVADYIRWAAREGIDDNLGKAEIVEERFEMKILETDDYEVWINGQMDVVFTTKLVDFKTVGRIEAPDPILGINSQALTYLTLLWANTDLRPKMASHRKILRKVNNGKSKATFFAEHDIFATEAQLRVHFQHMQSVAKDIIALYDSTSAAVESGEYPHLEAPPHPSGSCSWSCPFVKVCEGLDKTPMLFRSLVNPETEFEGGIFS